MDYRGCRLYVELEPYETGNNFWKWRSTAFYKEFRAFFDKPAIMRQMVVLKWAGHTMLVHPNLKKKLSRMYYGEMSKGTQKSKLPFLLTAGVMDEGNVYSDMIRMGLGVRIVGSTQIKTVMRSKLRWAGLIEVNPGEWVVPKQTIHDWIVEGTFITKTDPKVWAALKEWIPEVGDAYAAKHKPGGKLVMPIGTVQEPGPGMNRRRVPVEKMVELGTS